MKGVGRRVCLHDSSSDPARGLDTVDMDWRAQLLQIGYDRKRINLVDPRNTFMKPSEVRGLHLTGALRRILTEY